jgi:hypothetical protein
MSRGCRRFIIRAAAVTKSHISAVLTPHTRRQIADWGRGISLLISTRASGPDTRLGARCARQQRDRVEGHIAKGIDAVRTVMTKRLR